MFTCKTEKPFLQRHSKLSQISFGMKYFVSRREISLQKLISGSLSELKKLSFTVKGLYDIDSKFASGAIFVSSGNSFFKGGALQEKVLSEISQNPQENTCA